MTWLPLVGAAAATAAVILLPGLVLALILGLRGLWAWAMAGPFGVTVVVLASLAAPFAGLPWGLLPVGIVFAAIAVGLAVARAATGGFRRRDDSDPASGSPRGARWWAVPVGLVIAAVVLGVQLVRVVQDPGNISQTFDNIFHLNAIRYALETANASPLHLGSMTSENGGVWFYPSAWHAVASLVVQLTGAAIPVASNALAFVVALVLWPAGALLLTRTVFGSNAALLVSAGVLSAALPALPLLPMDYGVLYPYAFGLSLAPATIAATVVLLRLPAVRDSRPAWVWVVAVVGALPGVTIAHPGAFMAWLVIASLAVLVAFVLFLRTRPGRRRVVAASAGFAVYVLVAFAAWRVLRPPLDARTWLPTVTLGQGIGEAVTLSYWSGAIPIVVVAALLVGVVVAARRRTRIDVWMLAALAATSILYIAAISLPWLQLRDLLTAAWYNNAPRLASIVPIIIVPLAALGAAAVWNAWRRRSLERERGSSGSGFTVAVAVGAVLALVVATQLGAMQQAVREAASGYSLTPDSPLVSTDEMALLRRLPDEVPQDAVIAGSPWTGAGVAYAISGREVLMPHTLMDIDDETELINDELDDAATRPDVCTAILDKNVEYVLDFGDREVHGAVHPFPGLDDLATSSAVEAIDREGDAVLYKVIACGLDR
nr:DUF6541 family protein [Microbacterium lemovicicum]